MKFKLASEFIPRGDQPKAIDRLVEGIQGGKQSQVLQGITGSGKTFTIANVIEKVQKPTLVMAHNKTLAAQLYQEFKNLFPDNAVEYFVSYYDYYQPEAYIPRTDTYIEKDMSINDQIDRMRLSATRSLLERSDTLIVASVSCIYGLGMPEFYRKMNLQLAVGEERRRDEILIHLVEMHYNRNDFDFARGNFRVRGDVLDIFPAYEEALAYRIEFFGDEIERISAIDPLTGKLKQRVQSMVLYPGSHHVTPEEVRYDAIQRIRKELGERLEIFEKENKLVERQRLRERTLYDLEMIKEIGFCKGIENYSRHFSGRSAGEPPACLIDYFPKDFLLVVDESHQSIPQVHAMYNGDRSRKMALVDYGFRLPSAFDNRPLRFEEFYQKINQVVYVSATPANWEVWEAHGEVVQQIIRPTGLLDPTIEVRPAATQVDDCLEEIRVEALKGRRILVTVLTKRLAEELTDYLKDLGVKTQYLHSDVDTLERTQIIHDLRLGKYDVLVGINLLREGLDIPEVSLVAILDADKQGFLRSETALIQTCGRAARNLEGRVIMYADRLTDAIKKAVETTEMRRKIQSDYNAQHGITPRSATREAAPLVEKEAEELIYQHKEPSKSKKSDRIKESHEDYLTLDEVRAKIKEYADKMQQAAQALNFEEAANFRDLMRRYQDIEVTLS